MNKLAKIPFFLILFFVLAAAFIIFAYNLAEISINENFEEISSEDVSGETRVFRDHYGLPFIKSNNEADAYFSLGYIHAKDRLWQMDILRRIAYGELSEIIGKETVKADKFLRCFDIKSVSKDIFNSLNTKEKKLLRTYSAGINTFIEKNSGRLSFEFGALDYYPKAWRPEDCIALGKLIAFEMSLGIWIDAAFGDIANQLGPEMARSLIPGVHSDMPYIKDPRQAKGLHDDTLLSRDSRIPVETFFDAAASVREILGIKGTSIGSNCWAVSRSLYGAEGALLANDPHLPFMLPPHWYPVHIHNGEDNIIGMTLPGMPFVISGRNEKIAWGITNLMLDDFDYFIEKTDDSGDYYYFDGEKKKFEYIIDTIKVKNENDEVYYFRKNHRSKVISDFHLLENPSLLLQIPGDDEDNLFQNYVLTFKWTGHRKSNEIHSLYQISKAKGYREFSRALDSWGSPALVFHYADSNGFVAVRPAGIVPERRGMDPMHPNPGWDSQIDWKGYITSDKLDGMYNPEKKYVISANNRIESSDNIYFGNYWEPYSRAFRIEQLLTSSYDHNVKDAQYVQNDVLSPYASELLKETMPVLEKHQNLLKGNELKAYRQLKEWDYILTPASSTASIYSVYLENLIYSTFLDELGESLLKKYMFTSNIMSRKMMELLKQGKSDWFDIITTGERENRDFIIFESFRKAVKSLEQTFEGKNIQDWIWGDLHQLKLVHLFGVNDFMNETVNLGPYPIGGDNTTINNTQWRFFNPYQPVIGASMRLIADLKDTVIYVSMPGGVSGDPVHPNYSNQVQLWLNGGYIEYPFSAEPGNDYRESLFIKPVD